MKKVLVITAGVALICGVLASQDYKGRARILGYVYDQQGIPLEGVRVKLFCVKTQSGFEIATDKEGKWVALGVRGGTWHVDFEKTGFGPVKKSFEVSETTRNPEIRITLQKVEGIIITDELKEALAKANGLFGEKNYQGALEAYSGLLAKYPEAYVLWKNAGNCYFAMEQYDKAEESYMKVLEKEADNSDAMLLIGNCYINRNQTDKALEWYNKIEFEKIKDPTVLYNIGTNYYNISKFDEALKYFLKAVELQKDFLDGLYQLGLTYTTLQKTAEAITAFEQYMKLDPDSERAAQVKGFLDYLKKK